MKYTIREINSVQNWENLSPFLYLYRKISIVFVWMFLKTSLTPNKVTNLGSLFGIMAAVGFATGEGKYIFLGGIMSQIYMILDCVDGLLARVKNISSKFGSFFDIVSDVIINNLVLLGIGAGLYRQTNRLEIVLISFFALFGMNMTVVAHNTQMLVFRDEPLYKSRIINEIGKKQKFLHEIIIRAGLSGSFQFFIIGIGALLNKLIWSTVIIAIIQNIYWMSLVLLVYINKKICH
jgi:phosphatidylglycerophosphate synthase